MFFLISEVGLWVLRPLTGLLYQPRMIGDGDCGEIGGMKIDKGNYSSTALCWALGAFQFLNLTHSR
jgi:hypothetical protein